MKKISASLFTIIMMLLMVGSSNVFANDASAMGVEYRAHIQDVGDYPTDGTWVQGSDQIGTPGLSRRIEGVSIKLTGDIPAGAKIVYNLHIQDYGWICDVNDPSTWQEGPNFAGTTHQCKRIEAIQIKLLDASNHQLAGYSVQYSGHVQDVGDVAMVADGSKLGTEGASQRLECLSVGIVKVADLVPFYVALGAAEEIYANKDDYTPASVAALEKAVHDNPIADSLFNQAAVDAATKAINEALANVIKITKQPVVTQISSTLTVDLADEYNIDTLKGVLARAFKATLGEKTPDVFVESYVSDNPSVTSGELNPGTATIVIPAVTVTGISVAGPYTVTLKVTDTTNYVALRPALAAINAGAYKNTATVANYTGAEITGVTAANLTDVNAQVAADAMSNLGSLNKSQIQASVNKTLKI
ncbi:hypothetical protein GH810_03595 [Acetobacterium paludosum]|uniref:Uncharacterized protein n=1 Tax=Acetobacterium paludosum TaxID=52693 RepID=A0A923KRL4_9FIRM|nr:Ig domain-containing protein [Acetobacterium paludosum]MBC3887392.1 hypothetical protein [Acetobacterium paludosum]